MMQHNTQVLPKPYPQYGYWHVSRGYDFLKHCEVNKLPLLRAHMFLESKLPGITNDIIGTAWEYVPPKGGSNEHF